MKLPYRTEEKDSGTNETKEEKERTFRIKLTHKKIQAKTEQKKKKKAFTIKLKYKT
jgi:hypothetical protein